MLIRAMSLGIGRGELLEVLFVVSESPRRLDPTSRR